MPDFLGLEKSESGVFFTVPFAVAIKIYWSSTKSFTAKIAFIFSPGINGNKLTIGLPRLILLPWGTS